MNYEKTKTTYCYINHNKFPLVTIAGCLSNGKVFNTRTMFYVLLLIRASNENPFFFREEGIQNGLSKKVNFRGIIKIGYLFPLNCSLPLFAVRV